MIEQLGAFAGLAPVPARQRVIAVARVLHGLPYVWGGNDLAAGGLDCSGFVQMVYREAGVEPWASRYPAHLDLTAQGLCDALAPISDAEHPLPGDLVFYGPDPQHVVHVVMVTDVGPGGDVREVTGASRGNRTLTSPDLALAVKARIRTFSTPAYRGDIIGFRRMTAAE